MKTILKNLKWFSLSLILGLVLGGGLIFVKAWTEPTLAPPDGNLGAPINTSSNGQAKAGGLLLNSSGATNGLIVQNGNVGIGDTTPDTGLKLDVEGNVGATKYCDQNGANCKTITELSVAVKKPIYCVKDTSHAAGWSTVTFSAANCGGTLPNGDYKGSISSVYTNGNSCMVEHHFYMVQPTSTTGPSVTVWFDCAGTYHVAAVFVPMN